MNRLLAMFYDRMLAPVERRYFGEWRQQLLRDVEGSVVELGAGTGANLPYYPAGISELLLTEPDRHMRKRLVTRLAQSKPSHPYRVSGADGEQLPLPSASVDVVVSTLVLCSVRSLANTVTEAARVLRPGGRLIIMEHVAHHRAGASLVQHLGNPLWRRICGNCHLNRHTIEAIECGPFVFDTAPLTYELPASLPLANRIVRGQARRR